MCGELAGRQAKSQLLEIMHKGNVDGFIWTDLACSVNSNAKTENHISHRISLILSVRLSLVLILTKPCKFNALIVYIDIAVLWVCVCVFFFASRKTFFDIHRLCISQITYTCSVCVWYSWFLNSCDMFGSWHAVHVRLCVWLNPIQWMKKKSSKKKIAVDNQFQTKILR